MATGEDFVKWFNTKLRELKIDENVYASYMIGILEGDESIDEKKEALGEILSQTIENDVQTVLETIINKWEQCHAKNEEPDKVIEDMDTKLAKLMESKCIATAVTRQQHTPEEQRIREQILAQYSQVELDECEDDEVPNGCGGTVAAASTDPILMKNTNASDVAQLAKERREQAKLDSKAKKDKDKEDREKQKQLREEKKEKRKTVKGERRR